MRMRVMMERSWKRDLWDGWLTCVTACTDESGSFCLGWLMRVGEEGGGLMGDTGWKTCDGWTVHARLSLLISTTRKGMAATLCNKSNLSCSIEAFEYTHALRIIFVLPIPINDIHIPLSHSFLLRFLQIVFQE